MGRELRTALTTLALVLASCGGGPTSDFPSDEDDNGKRDAGGPRPDEEPGASTGGGAGAGDNGGGNGDTGSPSADAGASNPMDASLPLPDGGSADAGADAGDAEAGTGASDGNVANAR